MDRQVVTIKLRQKYEKLIQPKKNLSWCCERLKITWTLICTSYGNLSSPYFKAFWV